MDVTDADANNPEAVKAIAALLPLVDDNGSVGYHLPEILRDVDPHGYLVPGEVLRRLSSATTPEELRRLARIAGAYAIGTNPWRTIAKALLTRTHDQEERRSLFSALSDRGIRSWSGRPGEVPAIFVSAVESAKKSLADETDSELRPFWEWRVAGAEADLRYEEERAKEERGE